MVNEVFNQRENLEKNSILLISLYDESIMSEIGLSEIISMEKYKNRLHKEKERYGGTRRKSVIGKNYMLKYTRGNPFFYEPGFYIIKGYIRVFQLVNTP